MVKVDLGKCCTNCDHAQIRVQDFARGLELLEGGSIEFFTDTRIFCGKQARCREYCSETIEAAPPEDIFDG